LARPCQVGRAGLLASALGLLVACDIVQGFKNAGDALFPPVKTYLDVPGFQLVAGAYRELDIMTSSEPFIFARSASEGDSALYVMRYQDPKPCKIADVTSYWSDASEKAARTYIAYYDGTGSSTLHFSDTSCTPYLFEIGDADLPSGFTPSGLVVHTGSELYVVNPESGTMKLIASGVQDIDAERHLVRANGELGAFDRDWSLVGWVGSGVKRATVAFGSVFYEDDDGIHRLTVSNDDVPSVTTSDIDAAACNLTVLPASSELDLLAFFSPCDEERLVLWDNQTHQSVPLELPADPHFLRIAETRVTSLVGPRPHPNLAKDPFWAFYLTNIDKDTRTGSLVVKLPDDSELELGDGAALERTELAAPRTGGDYTGGFALLDAQSGSGRFVLWDTGGSVSDIATGVLRQPANPLWSRLVLEVDETRVDLAEVVGGEAVVVGRNAARQRYAYTAAHPVSEFAGKMAWFLNLEGTEGTLAIAGPDKGSRVEDDQRHEQLYSSTTVADGVHVTRNGFMNDLPGLVFFTHYDARTGTGRLEYSNAELGFSAIVSEGVADYVQPGSGLLYSVPYGEAAGIWLARAK
jgi:hypothetical protein